MICFVKSAMSNTTDYSLSLRQNLNFKYKPGPSPSMKLASKFFFSTVQYCSDGGEEVKPSQAHLKVSGDSRIT